MTDLTSTSNLFGVHVPQQVETARDILSKVSNLIDCVGTVVYILSVAIPDVRLLSALRNEVCLLARPSEGSRFVSRYYSDTG